MLTGNLPNTVGLGTAMAASAAYLSWHVRKSDLTRPMVSEPFALRHQRNADIPLSAMYLAKRFWIISSLLPDSYLLPNSPIHRV